MRLLASCLLVLVCVGEADAYAVDHVDVCRLVRDAEYAFVVEVTSVANLSFVIKKNKPPLPDHTLNFQRVDFRVVHALAGSHLAAGPKSYPAFFLAGGPAFVNVQYALHRSGDYALVFLKKSPATGYYHLRSADVASREQLVFSKQAVTGVLRSKPKHPLLFLQALFVAALRDKAMQKRYLSSPKGAGVDDLTETVGQSLLLRLAELSAWRQVHVDDTTKDQRPCFEAGPLFEEVEPILRSLRKHQDARWRKCVDEPAELLRELEQEHLEQQKERATQPLKGKRKD